MEPINDSMTEALDAAKVAIQDIMTADSASEADAATDNNGSEALLSAGESASSGAQTQAAQAVQSLPPAAEAKKDDLGYTLGVIAGVVAVVVIVAIVMKKRNKGRAVGGASKPDRGAPRTGGAVEIYVGNLSYDMTDAQLRKEFERFGVVGKARIITNRNSGKSKGFGFVDMNHRQEAQIAIKSLNGVEVMGRKLTVKESHKGGRQR